MIMSSVDRKATAKKFVQTVVEDVCKTRERIKQYVRKTPLEHSIWLSEETSKTSVYFKLGTTCVIFVVWARLISVPVLKYCTHIKVLYPY